VVRDQNYAAAGADASCDVSALREGACHVGEKAVEPRTRWLSSVSDIRFASISGTLRTMTRRVWIVAAFAAALVFTGAFASPASARIRLHEGIGPISLGMTRAQVVRALGKPDSIRRTRPRANTTLVHYDYALRKGWIVTLMTRGGVLRVAEITAMVRRERTREGLGLGSSEEQLRRAYPTLRCRDVRPQAGMTPVQRDCVLTRERRQTIFVIGLGPNPREVLQVIVRVRI
jgi:hypothetical protein